MADSYIQPGDAYVYFFSFFSIIIYTFSLCSYGRQDGRGQGVLGSISNAAYAGQTPLIQGTPVTQAGGPQQGAVLMVYGLNHTVMNCEKLFNLLCQYGNVVRVSVWRVSFDYLEFPY